MEYIFLVIAMLICGACIANLFIQAEAQDREISYKKRKLKNN